MMTMLGPLLVVMVQILAVELSGTNTSVQAFASVEQHTQYGYRPFSSKCFASSSSSSSSYTDSGSMSIMSKVSGFGHYRPIAEMVWKKLLCESSGFHLEECDYPSELKSNVAPAKGMKDCIVRMETRALQARKQQPQNNNNNNNDEGSGSDDTPAPSPPLSYARMALLETLPLRNNSDDDDEDEDENDGDTIIQTSGIQVLNLVLFPPRHTCLPVWGADFVSLPGNKHLLLLDAQPMNGDLSYEAHFADWYKTHDVATQFVWGGDLPEQVQPFVSQYALWTRWGVEDADDPISRIQGPLFAAVQDHLERYLELVMANTARSTTTTTTLSSTDVAEAADFQKDYIRYRHENDPARPMLRSLYGEEWTERVLSQVLFPQVQ